MTNNIHICEAANAHVTRGGKSCAENILFRAAGLPLASIGSRPRPSAASRTELLKVAFQAFPVEGGVLYTRCAWAGGTFFPVVCQFLVLAGNRFWFYVLLMYFRIEKRFKRRSVSVGVCRCLSVSVSSVCVRSSYVENITYGKYDILD
jgi:hypothetical protein